MSLLRSKTGSMSCMSDTVLSMNITFIGSCSKTKDCMSGGSFQSTSGRGRECFGTARGRYWSRGWLVTNQLKGCWWWWYFCQLCTVTLYTRRGMGKVTTWGQVNVVSYYRNSGSWVRRRINMQLSAVQNRITSRYTDPKAVLAIIPRRRHAINISLRFG